MDGSIAIGEFCGPHRNIGIVGIEKLGQRAGGSGELDLVGDKTCLAGTGLIRLNAVG